MPTAMTFTGTASTTPAVNTFDPAGPTVNIMYIRNTSADTDLRIKGAFSGNELDIIPFGVERNFEDTGGIPVFTVDTASGTATYNAGPVSV